MKLNWFISYGYQDEYYIPLQKKFEELNKKEDSNVDEYIKLKKDIEATEMKYCEQQQDLLLYYIISNFF